MINIRDALKIHSVSLRRRKPREVFYKKFLWKFSQNSQENNCFRICFLIKLQVGGLQRFWKRDSDTGVFLQILTSYLENTSGRLLLLEHTILEFKGRLMQIWKSCNSTKHYLFHSVSYKNLVWGFKMRTNRGIYKVFH